jgi:DNA mismatch repair ATPase MutS
MVNIKDYVKGWVVMSKLYSYYLKLKEKESDVLYLFKSGIFYIFLDNDALLVNEKIGLRLSNLNQNVLKLVFPKTV